ncbi:Protein of unknown function [Propionibacterium freudenreichii]|nr:Protein of unknown function [Propionibacterium freudenreichii]CEG92902.1 Protein of unknown function [Propionibacterium freudenreichii]CEI31242.1 Protein of unknown function [Propionibacterium freudenreichii]CEI50049.1 Protein of unknown function [Propionibacterium freudenreichii]
MPDEVERHATHEAQAVERTEGLVRAGQAQGTLHADRREEDPATRGKWP